MPDAKQELEAKREQLKALLEAMNESEAKLSRSEAEAVDMGGGPDHPEVKKAVLAYEVQALTEAEAATAKTWSTIAGVAKVGEAVMLVPAGAWKPRKYSPSHSEPETSLKRGIVQNPAGPQKFNKYDTVELHSLEGPLAQHNGRKAWIAWMKGDTVAVTFRKPNAYGAAEVWVRPADVHAQLSFKNIRALSGTKDLPGVYVVTHSKLPVTETIERTSRVVGHIEQGSKVEVVEVDYKEARCRGRIASPAGWISLRHGAGSFAHLKSFEETFVWVKFDDEALGALPKPITAWTKVEVFRELTAEDEVKAAAVLKRKADLQKREKEIKETLKPRIRAVLDEIEEPRHEKGAKSREEAVQGAEEGLGTPTAEQQKLLARLAVEMQLAGTPDVEGMTPARASYELKVLHEEAREAAIKKACMAAGDRHLQHSRKVYNAEQELKALYSRVEEKSGDIFGDALAVLKGEDLAQEEALRQRLKDLEVSAEDIDKNCKAYQQSAKSSSKSKAISSISADIVRAGVERAKAHGQTSMSNELNEAAWLACIAGDVEALKKAAGGCFAAFSRRWNTVMVNMGYQCDYNEYEFDGDELLGFRYGNHDVKCPHPADGNDPLEAWTREWTKESDSYSRWQPTLLKAALDHGWSADVIKALEELGVPENYTFTGFSSTYVVNVKEYDAAEGALVLSTLSGDELHLPGTAEMTGSELAASVRQLKSIRADTDVKIFFDDLTRLAPHDIVRKQLALHASP